MNDEPSLCARCSMGRPDDSGRYTAKFEDYSANRTEQLKVELCPDCWREVKADAGGDT